MTKEVQDLKIQIENVSYLKSQVAGQLEDARRRLEDDERVSFFSTTSRRSVSTLLENNYNNNNSLHYASFGQEPRNLYC